MFSGCIFRLQATDKTHKRRQKQSTQFVIHRAQILFPEDEDSSITAKEEATGIESVQFASRKVGTDGMLYFLEQEILKIEDGIENLDYCELSKKFTNLESELDSLQQQTEEMESNQSEFEQKFSSRVQEVSALVDKCEPVYNNLDFHGSDEEEEEET